MFNQIKVIWYGLGGCFDGYHPVDSKFWLYLAGVLFNAGMLMMNSFISFSFDRDTVWRDSVGLSPTPAFWLAITSTVLLAFVALHFISYLAFLLSAKLHDREEQLIGVTRWGVFFTVLAVMAVTTVEIYRNYHGSEDIAQSNTEVHIDDPTVNLDVQYQSQEDSVAASYASQIIHVQEEIDVIQHWTGKAHSCTRTPCPTRKQGKGTVGAHWKGTLTAYGSQYLETLREKKQTLENRQVTEVERVRGRKETVSASLIGAYQKDVNRYESELALKNRTFKGFVFIAFPAAFIIAFLLSEITYMAIEYLYETERLSRPAVTVEPSGRIVSGQTSTTVQTFTSRKQYAIICECCGNAAIKTRSDARFCSDPCRVAYNRAKQSLEEEETV